jgi:hypothetical protein
MSTKLSQLPTLTEKLSGSDLFSVAEDMGLGDYSAKKIQYTDLLTSIYRDTSGNFSLLKLNDVGINTILNGQTISWNSATSKFIATNINTTVAQHNIASISHDFLINGSLANNDIIVFNGSLWTNKQVSTLITQNFDTTILRKNFKYITTTYAVPTSEIGYTYITGANFIHYNLPQCANTSNELTGIYYTFSRNINNNTVSATVISAIGSIANSPSYGMISSVVSGEYYANITLLNIGANNWIITSGHGDWTTN